VAFIFGLAPYYRTPYFYSISIMMAKTYYNKDNITTPLELLNLYLTTGTSKGDSTNKLYWKLNNDLSWDAMLNEGCQADLAPLLYYIIKKGTIKQNEMHVTVETHNNLESLYYQHLAKNLCQFNELDNILSLFEDQHIDVILLKGAELSKNYYPDQSLRPMFDIDLLVRECDMKHAKKCLMSQGFSFQKGPFSLTENNYKERHFHYPYIKNVFNTSVVIELHKDIASPSDVIHNNIQDFWNNAVPISVNHRHILKTSTENILLHIFWHTYVNISKCQYVRSIWLIDIALIIWQTDNEIDWEYLARTANEWGIQKQIHLCLYLLQSLFNISPRKEMPKRRSLSIFVIPLFDKMMLTIEILNNRQREQNVIFSLILGQIVLNSLRDNLRFFFLGGFKASTLLPKRTRIQIRYKVSTRIASYVFYVIHPFILTIEAIKSIFNIFRSN